ncbi:MAG: hypothetical protein OEY59_00595 [Deltaproteobacteria bacterium]|nr:hypothetical protein [Deltaproteobacteria bacterium]
MKFGLFHQTARACIFLALTLYFICGSLSAQQLFNLAEIDPNQTNFEVYHSFQHKLLLVALTSKPNAKFDCSANRYLFYDFAKEIFFEIPAGFLLISKDYSKVFYTKIHTLGGLNLNNTKQWESDAALIIKALNISPETMEKAKIVSRVSNLACWMQPALYNLKSKKSQTFPYLAANLCKNKFCGEAFWPSNKEVQFWMQVDPKLHHLIRLNVNSLDIKYKKKGPVNLRDNLNQSSAPRENLINEKNLGKGQIKLLAKKGKEILLVWNTTTKGTIKIDLNRTKADHFASSHYQPLIQNLINKQKIPQAKSLIQFALWLEPKSQLILYENIKLMGSLLMYDEVFKSLKKDFDKPQRKGICQKIHLDKTFQKLWKNPLFIEAFKKNCS